MLKVLLEQLSEIVDGLDPDAIPLCEVPNLWKDFARGERLMASARTLLARRVEEGNTWRGAGFRSAAEQMALLSGTSVNTEKKALETSKRVRKLPKTAAAMRKGKLSPAKAESIAGAADVNPDAEDELLEGAEKKPLAELRDDCLKARAMNADEAHRRIHRDRFVRVHKDNEGAWNLYARGTADDGARFMNVLEPLIDEHFKKAKAEGREEPTVAYAFDALMEMADLADTANPDADAPAGTDPAKTPKQKPKPAKYLAIIRLDYETLVRGAIEGEEMCEIRGVGPIPVRIARELLGDAILKLVITKGVDVINVTHLGRSATIAQKVALWWQQHMCTRNTCTRTARLENDHGPEWHKTKHTRLDELDLVCNVDHDLKSNHGWDFVTGAGRRALVPPDDPRHPNYRGPPG
jgi:Domain of unknown function (DUF222)